MSVTVADSLLQNFVRKVLRPEVLLLVLRSVRSSPLAWLTYELTAARKKTQDQREAVLKALLAAAPQYVAVNGELAETALAQIVLQEENRLLGLTRGPQVTSLQTSLKRLPAFANTPIQDRVSNRTLIESHCLRFCTKKWVQAIRAAGSLLVASRDWARGSSDHCRPWVPPIVRSAAREVALRSEDVLLLVHRPLVTLCRSADLARVAGCGSLLVRVRPDAEREGFEQGYCEARHRARAKPVRLVVPSGVDC